MKKSKKNKIVTRDDECVSIDKELMWSLDITLAIIIRDSIRKHVESSKLGVPGFLVADPSGIVFDDEWKKARAKWEKELNEVADMFDTYATKDTDEECVKEMFAKLTEIFPHLWD